MSNAPGLRGVLAPDDWAGLRSLYGSHEGFTDGTLVVTDNEGNEQVRALCDSSRREPFAALLYYHEPQRGISYARNACLDHVPHATDFIAMIDDDEIPAQDWL